MAAEPLSAQQPVTAPADAALERLFQRHRRFRDDRAREELIRRFGPLAIGCARRYHVPGGEPMEDLVHAAGLAEGCRLDVADALEARTSRPQPLEIDVMKSRGGARDPGYELVEYAASAQPAVAALSERDRRVLQLRVADGLSQREIAQRVGVSQMQVSRMARTVARLREAVGEQPT